MDATKTRKNRAKTTPAKDFVALWMKHQPTDNMAAMEEATGLDRKGILTKANNLRQAAEKAGKTLNLPEFKSSAGRGKTDFDELSAIIDAAQKQADNENNSENSGS